MQIRSNPTAEAPPDQKPAQRRQMVRTTLGGQHSHETKDGLKVHIWRRDDKYLARGRLNRRQFGQVLGADERTAAQNLRRLLTEIEDGRFVAPSDARHRVLQRSPSVKLTLRDVVDGFLTEKRGLRGQKTCDDYKARLMPVLEFAESSINQSRWTHAIDLDRDFALKLKQFLYQRKSSRNGRPGGEPTPVSARQIYNILDCFRTVLNWARSPEVRKLPADWSNPLTKEIVGERARKNALREVAYPLDERVRLVSQMDEWQLCQITPLLVLPLRPEEFAGLLITDVDWEMMRLNFGTRCGGADFNKGKQNFVVPFPAELGPVFARCVGGRLIGPLLRTRSAFDRRRPASLTSDEHLRELFESKLRRAPAGTIMTDQDRKQVFRELLRELGGVSPDELSKAFQGLRRSAGFIKKIKSYELRHAITTEMHRAGIPHLELNYMTGHTTRDILREYVPMDPDGAMSKYFEAIQPLLDAIQGRCRELGIVECPNDDSKLLSEVAGKEQLHFGLAATPKSRHAIIDGPRQRTC